MKKNTTLTLVNTLALIAVLIVNYLSNSLPLNGFTPGQLSDLYPNLFTPAGVTFSIWGIIYLLIIVWVFLQIVALVNPKLAARITPVQQRIGWLFAISCVLNISWLFAWHWRQVGLSVVVMIGLLVSLVLINLAIRRGKKSDVLERATVYLPFGIYQGWITVALIANVTAWLVSMDWHGGGNEVPITLMMIGIGTLVAAFILFRQRNFGHGLAVTWALTGIYIKRSSIAGDDSHTVAVMAASCAGLLLLFLLGVLFKK